MNFIITKSRFAAFKRKSIIILIMLLMVLIMAEVFEQILIYYRNYGHVGFTSKQKYMLRKVI